MLFLLTDAVFNLFLFFFKAQRAAVEYGRFRIPSSLAFSALPGGSAHTALRPADHPPAGHGAKRQGKVWISSLFSRGPVSSLGITGFHPAHL